MFPTRAAWRILGAHCAVRAKAELWTLDHSFERIGEALEGLRVRVFA
jgi:hypothetical protein